MSRPARFAVRPLGTRSSVGEGLHCDGQGLKRLPERLLDCNRNSESCSSKKCVAEGRGTSLRGEEVATATSLRTSWRSSWTLASAFPISNPRGLLDRARRAEASGFSSLALLDRLTFDNPEPLTALSVLAGATEHIRLQTEVLLGPLRSTALLAKQVATLDHMSDGRFTLGVGLGGRADDHAAAGTPMSRRGAMLDRQLGELRGIWAREAYSADAADRDAASGAVIGPLPCSPVGPSILIGAFAPAALGRVARYGDRIPVRRCPAMGRPAGHDGTGAMGCGGTHQTTEIGVPGERSGQHHRVRPCSDLRLLRLHRKSGMGRPTQRSERDSGHCGHVPRIRRR